MLNDAGTIKISLLLDSDNKNFCQAPDLSTVGSGLVWYYVSAVKQGLIILVKYWRPPVNINLLVLHASRV